MNSNIKRIYVIAKKIFDSYRKINLFNEDINLFFYDRRIYKLQELDIETLKKDWQQNKGTFIYDFKNKFKNLSKKNKKHESLIKNVYTQLNIIEIIMYNIKNYDAFNKMVKEAVIPTVLEEKKDFRKIEQHCEKKFIIEMKGKHKKIFYNTQKISECVKLKGRYIDELFKLYCDCKYEQIDKEKYENIVEKRNIQLIDQCKSKIHVQTHFLEQGYIEVFCPLCEKTYKIYLKINEENMQISKKYRNKELREKSYIYELGYTLKNNKEKRMEALENALLLGDWHSQTIIRFIQNKLIDYNGKRKNMEKAVQIWKEDLEDFIKIIYKKYGVKLNKEKK